MGKTLLTNFSLSTERMSLKNNTHSTVTANSTSSSLPQANPPEESTPDQHIANNDESKKYYIGSLYSDNLRITSSPAYRRLQDKTQLFPLEKNDYARTRLTHSSEVSSTARALAQCIILELKDKSYDLNSRDADILSMAAVNCGLLHDIGNPPFGHYGEQIIRDYFKKNWTSLIVCTNSKKGTLLNKLIKRTDTKYYDFACFDGNAQALRVVSKLEYYNGGHGLDLTATVLGGIIKYPFDSKEGKKKCKFGYFQSESKLIDFLSQQKAFILDRRNPIALIMEAADDICMLVSDMEDGIKKGCITYDTIANYHSTRDKEVQKFRNHFTAAYKENSKNGISGNRTLFTVTRLLSQIKNQLITDCAQIFVFNVDQIFSGTSQLSSPFDPSKSGHSLIELSPLQPLIAMKNKIMANVYASDLIVAPELRGQTILTNLLDRFVRALLETKTKRIVTSEAKQSNQKVLQLISKNYLHAYEDAIKVQENYDQVEEVYLRLHLAVDQVCGMTDSYAEDVYKELNGK
jgi:dGTPase